MSRADEFTFLESLPPYPGNLAGRRIDVKEHPQVRTVNPAIGHQGRRPSHDPCLIQEWTRLVGDPLDDPSAHEKFLNTGVGKGCVYERYPVDTREIDRDGIYLFPGGMVGICNGACFGSWLHLPGTGESGRVHKKRRASVTVLLKGYVVETICQRSGCSGVNWLAFRQRPDACNTLICSINIDTDKILRRINFNGGDLRGDQVNTYGIQMDPSDCVASCKIGLYGTVVEGNADCGGI